MSTAIVPISDIERMAVAVSKSGLFGVKTAEQAMSLMLIAQAEGMHPAIAARDYHVINGRPALRADAMLARFQAAGGSVRWLEMSDRRVAAEFHHPQGGTVEIDWTPERAKQAGIRNEMHSKYPRQMLRARVISEGIRTVFPGVVVGSFTPEELRDPSPEIAPTMDEDLQSTALAQIAAAGDMAALKAAFDAATKAARKAGQPLPEEIIAAKDARKAALSAPPPAVEDADVEDVI
jgi:hypothetical protein